MSPKSQRLLDLVRFNDIALAAADLSEANGLTTRHFRGRLSDAEEFSISRVLYSVLLNADDQ